MERYARAELAAGVVIYEEGEVQCLQRRTAVQPDNQIPIAYEQLVRHQRANRLEILGTMLASFRERLLRAIENSITMEERKKARLRAIL